MDGALLTFTLTPCPALPHFPQRSDGRRMDTTLRTMSVTIGIYRGEALSLSNLFNIITQGEQSIHAQSSHQTSHLRRKGGPLRLIPASFTLLEPRASSPPPRITARLHQDG